MSLDHPMCSYPISPYGDDVIDGPAASSIEWRIAGPSSSRARGSRRSRIGQSAWRPPAQGGTTVWVSLVGSVGGEIGHVISRWSSRLTSRGLLVAAVSVCPDLGVAEAFPRFA